VYPAAGFVEEAKAASAHTVEINLKSSDRAGLFDEGLYGPASKAVPAFVDRIIQGN
jgi:NAD-dependent deacetylase